MSRLSRLSRDGALLLALLLSVSATTAQRSRRSGTPRMGLGVATSEDASWQGVRWEPFKIAIGAFYAICVQRVFESVISNLNHTTPRLLVSVTKIDFLFEKGDYILVCQLLSFIIWLSLYYVHNVRLYFLVPAHQSFRRALTHIMLTVALGQFYFLGATTGDPSTNQLLIILSILVIDALFPLILGSILSLRARITWVIRGILQAGTVMLILLFVDPQSYTHIEWSAGMLTLMLIQLVIIAPIESSRVNSMLKT